MPDENGKGSATIGSGAAEWLRDFLESVRDVLWMATVDGSRYLFVNRAVESVYGRSPQEFESNPDLWIEVVHPEDRERVEREGRELHRTGFIESEYRILTPDGLVRWLRDKKYLFRDEKGAPLRIGGVATDITERKQAEADLRSEHRNLENRYEAQTVKLERAEVRFRDLFENAGDPMYVIAPDGTITALNPAWERVTGYRRSDWLGRSFAPLVHPDDLPQTMESFQRALKEGRQVIYEARYRAADGEWRTAEHSLAPHAAPRGAVLDVVGIARDLTERRRAEEKRLLFEKRLLQSQKLESLGVLAGGIAHDFNNLLMGVVGNVDLALHEEGLNPALHRHLEGIRTASRSLSALTGQLLAYAGRGKFEKSSIDLTSVIREMIPLLKIPATENVEWHLDLDPHLPRVQADPSQVRQVVMNLATNAAQALEGGRGTIRIRTGAMDASRDYLAGTLLGDDRPEGRYVVFEITDTGRGIREDARPLIFDPFFTTRSEGHGLGLAAVIGILRRHGGTVRVESRPGFGSTFTVLLPCAQQLREVREDATGIGLVPGTGTVLVVDDKEIVRSMAREMLEAAGYEVREAVDGLEALKVLEQEASHVDLVLLDLQMPKMTGTEVLRRFRELRKDLPVILSSGYAEEDLGPMDSEETRFLQKPYRATTLTRMVAELLGKGPGI